MKPPPKTILAIVGVVSAFIVVSGVIGLWQSIDAQAWFRVGFESVLTLAGVIGIFTAMGRFNTSPAWALISVTGAVLVCTLLGNATSGQGGGMGMNPVTLFRSVLKNPLSAARLAAVGVLGVAFVMTLFLRVPGVAFGRFFRGLACLAPVVALGVLWRAGPLREWMYGLDVKIQVALAIVVFFGFLVLISAGVHFLIRSLEAGVESAGDPVSGVGAGAAQALRPDDRAKDDRPIAES